MAAWVASVCSVIALIASIIALYVNYKTLQVRDEFRDQMEEIVEKHCVDRIEFRAHVAADEEFQRSLLKSVSDKDNISDKLLEAKFETIKMLVANVATRVDSLTKSVEDKLRYGLGR